MNNDHHKYIVYKAVSPSFMNDLLRKYRTTAENVDGAVFSTSYDSKDHFKIAWPKVTSFWKDYCELFTTSSEVTGKSCLYEVNPNEATLRILMKFVHAKKTKVLTEKFLCTALAIIQELIKQYINFNSSESINGEEDEDQLLVCIVSHSNMHGNEHGLDNAGSSIGSDGNLQTEVEFRFPKCRISQTTFNDRIIERIISQFRAFKLMSTLATEPIGGWEKIIQPMNSYFPVHGSKTCNDAWTLPLKTYKCSPVVHLPLDVDQELESQDIYSYFDHSEHSWLKTRAAGQKSIIDKAPDEIDFTPLMLSSWFSTEITNFNFDDDIPSDDEELSGKGKMESVVSSDEPRDQVHYLIPLISKERLKNDMYWTELGRTLYNIFRRFPDTGFDVWNTYDVHPEPREDYNRYKWEDFAEDDGVNNYLSIRTIAAYAREDSPDRYAEWHSLWMEESVKKSMSLIENDIAEVLYRYLWLDYMTVEGNIWYRFDRDATRLNKMCGATKFLQEIPNIIKVYLNLRSKFNDDLMNVSDPKTKKEAQSQTGQIDKIVKFLGTSKSQTAMVKMCYTKFHRDGVAKYFDTNPNLMSWNNVVSHVHNTEIIIRKGKMEDFITKSTGISLETKMYNWDHPAIKELMVWFRQMFPEEDFRDYFLKICSSFLYGRNAERYFIVLSGKGANGKSKIIALIEKVLGDYAVNFPVEVLTGNKRDASGPSPELAQAAGSRVAFSSEPESSIPLKCGNIKRWTGGDRFYARKNREDGGSVEASFKMVFVCNIIPQIEGADPAVVDRFRYLPFLSRYCEDAPETEEEQYAQRRFPIDYLFEEKLAKFRRPMAWIMYQYFSRYRKEGLKSPTIVKEYTAKHWQDTDPYEMFFTEYMLKVDVEEEPENRLLVTTLYTRFKPWFKLNFPTSNPPNAATVTTHMAIKLGNPKGRFWVDWKLKADEQYGFGNNRGAGARKGAGIA